VREDCWIGAQGIGRKALLELDTIVSPDTSCGGIGTLLRRNGISQSAEALPTGVVRNYSIRAAALLD
jgi:hypothetical protein